MSCWLIAALDPNPARLVERFVDGALGQLEQRIFITDQCHQRLVGVMTTSISRIFCSATEITSVARPILTIVSCAWI